MTLTQADIVQEIYKTHKSFTQIEASDAIESFLNISKRCLSEGNDLLISGFGKFNVQDKRERKGQTP